MKRYDIDDLLNIINRLRQPDGCPWDRVQTHESIKNGLIEECYEVVDAIEKNDFDALKEELGDVLMQVVFHSSLAADEGKFDFSDVVDGVCKKLVYRHPHIFSDTVAETVDEVLNNWDELKKKEKHQSTYTDTLKSVPTSLPALILAQKVTKRAAKADFGAYVNDVSFEKICNDAKKATENGNTEEEVFQCFGDMLLDTVCLARILKINSEEALRKATERFIKRFEQSENEIINKKDN